MPEEIKVYNTKKGRRYKIGELEYISVTTPLNLISNSDLDKWRGRVGRTKAERITNKASKRGTYVHAACESVCLGKDWRTNSELPERLKVNAKFIVDVEAFKSWFEESVEEVIGVETCVYRNDWGVAGRHDLLCRLKGQEHLTLVDFKTGSQVRKTHWLQLAVYGRMDTKSKEITERIILQIREGKCKVKKIKDKSAERWDYDIKSYLHILEAWKWKSNIK